MGKKEVGISDKDRIKRFLSEQVNAVHKTFQVLNEERVSSARKENWSSVVKMGEALSKRATLVGMLCTEDTPKVEVLERNMKICFSLLQGLLLLSRGCTVGAGYTLSSCILRSLKQIIDSIFTLTKECVDSYGSPHENLLIPVLVGRVWDASSALKKTPATNVTAIAQAITQVTMKMKDVLQEIKELKSVTYDPVDEAPDLVDEVPEETTPEDVENISNDSDDDSRAGGDIGNDLSEEEMMIAQSTAEFISETIDVVNNLVRSIIGLLSREGQDGLLRDSIDSLEKMLKFCQELGAQVDELGTCMYPPQAIHVMKVALGNISSIIDNVQAELENLGCSAEDFFHSCTSLRDSMRRLESEMHSSDPTDLMQKMDRMIDFTIV